ncbi:DUF2637 domain-containing protein [Pseudonocardia sp. Ae505_Ps2]|uniref:DUF2637 domain-containing protein n=1 Tax=Pseudonocardia sp. Ae505_Ps2 TaxID=1885034 RepID=UPI00094ECBBD|nr:DUF2637 domain-containing protein [Pseudonocardia sp. Ae505_Ps2]
MTETSKKITGRTVGTAVLLAVVIGAPAAASWHGLAAAGETALGLEGPMSALVPLVLDAAGAYAAVLSVRDVLAGDSAAMNRLLVWAYAVGSAGFNAWHADKVGGFAAAVFYAVASISAVLLWDRTLRAMRRDRLRDAGAVSPPAPRFRVARWVVARNETWHAWQAAVVEGVSDPVEAVRLIRPADHLPLRGHITRLPEQGETATHELRPAQSPADLPADGPVQDTPLLREMPKSDAIRHAVAALDEDATAKDVSAWLAEHRVEVAPTYVSDVLRRDQRKSITDEPPLRLAN